MICSRCLADAPCTNYTVRRRVGFGYQTVKRSLCARCAPPLSPRPSRRPSTSPLHAAAKES